MSIINPESIADVIRECAELYILPRYKALASHEISSKTGPRDLVTQADLDVEEHLSRVLPEFLTGSTVIGEEGVSRGTISLDILHSHSDVVWIVDPVDGTHNFVHHKREFGVMLACIIDGRAQYSWIYDVLGNEMAITERGSGAFIGEKRLAVASKAEPGEMQGHINPGFFPREYREVIKNAQQNLKSCRSLNCAAHEYLHIAKGQAQFSLYSRLKHWDHLAGCLMVQEAGGYAALWNGQPYTPQNVDTGLIVASDKATWETIYHLFIKNNIG